MKKLTFRTSRYGRMLEPKVVVGGSHDTFFYPVRDNRIEIHDTTYIILEANNGSGFIHKSKLNTNGTFSVGKTWRLPELRAIQVVNVCHCMLETGANDTLPLVASFLQYYLVSNIQVADGESVGANQFPRCSDTTFLRRCTRVYTTA